MDKPKVICPLTKKDLDNSCPTCKLVIIDDGVITGCAIRRNILNIFANKKLSEKFKQDIINFKENMTHGFR
jgi:hypothetical protein